MRPRIKSISTQNGIKPVLTKEVRDLFYIGKVKAVKVTTSGTRSEIERKFQKKLERSRMESWSHNDEIAKMVHENGIKTKYFAA